MEEPVSVSPNSAIESSFSLEKVMKVLTKVGLALFGAAGVTGSGIEIYNHTVSGDARAWIVTEEARKLEKEKESLWEAYQVQKIAEKQAEEKANEKFNEKFNDAFDKDPKKGKGK